MNDVGNREQFFGLFGAASGYANVFFVLFSCEEPLTLTHKGKGYSTVGTD